MDRFEEEDTQVLGISVDSTATNASWAESLGVQDILLLSDFWPHGEVAKKYGVLRSSGETERAIFLIDKKGIIRYIDIHDINTRPKLEVLIKEIERLED